MAGFVGDGGRETRLRARPENEIVEPAVGRHAHEGSRPEIGEADVAGACQRVGGRERDDRSLGSHELGCHVPVRDGKDGKGDVDPPVKERFDLLPGAQGMEVEHHVRVTLQEGLQDLSQDAGLAGRAEPERKVPDLSVAGLASRHHGVVAVLEDAADLLEEGAARLRQRDKMPRSMKESDSELAFEVLNLLGKRRLRDVKFVGSPAEVKFVGDRDEITQVPKLQLLPSPLFLKTT